METIAGACTPSDAARTDGGAGKVLGYQRARPVVECGRVPYARRLSEILVRSSGAGVAAGYGAAPPARFMNHRLASHLEVLLSDASKAFCLPSVAPGTEQAM